MSDWPKLTTVDWIKDRSIKKIKPTEFGVEIEMMDPSPREQAIMKHHKLIDSDKTEVKDETGNVKLLAITNPRAAISVAGTVAGTTGVVAASVGVALTLANLEAVGGCGAGLVIVDSVQVSKKPDGFKEISVSATRYPLITS